MLFTSELFRTSSGKIMRRLCRDVTEARQLGYISMLGARPW
jgi:acyl-coenzyme A synthetase/AMP-(fatty) acid ligase